MEKMKIQSAEIQAFEKAHIERVRALSPECMVLLKNKGVLPLGEVKKVALFGNGARRTIKGGTGSGDVNVRDFITVEQGLMGAGIEITTTAWMDQYDQMIAEKKAEFYKQIRKEADELGEFPMFYAMGKEMLEPEYDLALEGEGDAAIYVLARNSGEGTDRKIEKGDLYLTDTEIRNILYLNKKFEKFVLVLNIGGMVDLSPVQEVETILFMGQLGSASGDALVDVLLGKSYPSGKLTMSWAPMEAYASTPGFGDPNDTVYQEGIYVGYRYFDTIGLTPDYPFGFGLGYTEFSVEPVEICADWEKVSVTVDVKNTGNAAGKEVVQVYVSAPEGTIDQPMQELKAFEKTKELQPGESQTLTISYETRTMASYHEDASAYRMEAGTYYVRVGNCSRNTAIAGSISLDQTVVIEQDKKICNESGFEDLKPEKNCITYAEEGAQKEQAPWVALKAEDWETKTIVYEEMPQEIPAGEGCSFDAVVAGEKTMDEFVAGLDDEKLAYLCIGAYEVTNEMQEVIGSAATTVAGAAGETTKQLSDLNVPILVMADGPAGLRLCAQYKDIDGIAKPLTSNSNGEYMAVYTPEERQELLNADALSEEEMAEPTCYQYCVAVPIGTCIAQSWSREVAQACADMIGTEMEMFGVHLWLAPAMNLYRSPLCGRNFEYYSEDPVLSGSIAAAMTKSIQKHPGCAATIKHYALNNQETNRYFSNSVVNERAIRELYLKGFEICVKEAQPHFIMTSYNLVNGEHTCNSRDLQTYVLRDEWGFEGVVMTDWLVTGGMGQTGEKWACASAAGNVYAGNDITMPGVPGDLRDMLDALDNEGHAYPLTRGILQLSAKRILNMIKNLA